MFNKINKYGDLIVPVVYYTVYYLILQKLMHDIKFLDFIKRESMKYTGKDGRETDQDIIFRLNVVLKKITPFSSCIIRGLVFRKVLLIKGYSFYPLNIGVQKRNGSIFAHAWIVSENKFVKIEEL